MHAADGADRADRNAISLAIKLQTSAGVGWWHRFQDLWLIADPEERTAAWWRDYLKEHAPDVLFIVLDAGTVPKGRPAWSSVTAPGSVEWLKKHWRRAKREPEPEAEPE